MKLLWFCLLCFQQQCQSAGLGLIPRELRVLEESVNKESKVHANHLKLLSGLRLRK